MYRQVAGIEARRGIVAGVLLGVFASGILGVLGVFASLTVWASGAECRSRPVH